MKLITMLCLYTSASRKRIRLKLSRGNKRLIMWLKIGFGQDVMPIYIVRDSDKTVWIRVRALLELIRAIFETQSLGIELVYLYFIAIATIYAVCVKNCPSIESEAATIRGKRLTNCPTFPQGLWVVIKNI